MFLLRNVDNLSKLDADIFPMKCVERAIEVSYCGRCTDRIPPLCHNTCGALVRGCFAGFYSGLEGEFNNLWNVVRQLFMSMKENIQALVVKAATLVVVDVRSCTNFMPRVGF